MFFHALFPRCLGKVRPLLGSLRHVDQFIALSGLDSHRHVSGFKRRHRCFVVEHMEGGTPFSGRVLFGIETDH